jgi:queuine tRNA-ribosyltransferase
MGLGLWCVGIDSLFEFRISDFPRIITPVPALRFDISHRCRSTHARVGRVTTLHGSFDTPAFMPVGTKATVKGLLPDVVAGTGSQVILNNTYHLMLRPGSDLIARRGGVHRFMAWDGPILTDSGGFQVFSLSDINQIDDDGVTFRSHIDGATVRLTPERSMAVQNELGADIIMAFDDCPPGDVGTGDYSQRNRQAIERTLNWLPRCIEAHARANEQSLFGIVQGGTDLDLRTYCAGQVTAHDLPGYAIGGVAVGEAPELMVKVVEHTAPLLPADRPRYLMGVGYERDIVAAVRAGVDMFDCVLPTRNGRNANAFTATGQVRLRNAACAEDDGPIDPVCDCPACRRFSRAYVRHLFMSDEMLGPILVSLHNIRHFQRLMLDIRQAIRDDAWSSLAQRWPVIGLN